MLADTLKILKAYDIKLDKRRGQNYLINSSVLSKILDHAHLSPRDRVLEIGAGIGTLTIPLAKRAGKVFAVEKDRKIAEIFIKRLNDADISNVEVIVGDATKIKLPTFNKVVSNLPYQISSPITFKLLKKDFDFGILMYQLEFAERMVARPGASNYSRLSVMVHFCAVAEMLFKVSSTAFFPEPKISSAVIKLKPNRQSDVDEFFLKTSRALFQHKRKKVRNALLDSFHEITPRDKTTLKSAVSKLEPELINSRVFKLKPEEIMEISRELKDILEEN
jgi:16S rRNA (adenine1518-N6/adenine1519-N6)-dimethyltransferase